MKVKIFHTVDLEEVPGKADPLIESALKSIELASDRIKEIKKIKSKSIDNALEKISELRSLLLDVDFALGDCESMLSGYLNTKTSTANEPNEGH